MTDLNWQFSWLRDVVLLIDVSRYVEFVDWSFMFQNKVRCSIAKASQGASWKDPKFGDHTVGGASVGMVTGGYHWVDPMVSYVTQCNNFKDALNGKPVDMAWLDSEQYWASWVEYFNSRQGGAITQIIRPNQISDVTQEMYRILDRDLDMPVGVYSAPYFMNDYSKPMIEWTATISKWLASYPYKRGNLNVTWDSFLNFWLPVRDLWYPPGYPNEAKNPIIWQFSGDKFLLPGISGAVDLNFWYGTLSDLHNFVDWREWNIEPVEPVIPIFNVEVLVEGLRKRTGPSTSSPIVGYRSIRDIISVKSLAGSDIWIEDEDGLFSAFYYKQKQYMRLDRR